MGWTFKRGHSKKDIIEGRLKEWRTDKCQGTCLAHALKENVLWAVWELRYGDGRTRRFIACYLLAKDGNFGWGYKDVEESSAPPFYHCPLSFLHMVPPVNPRWREKVRQFHRKQRRRFYIGQVISLQASLIPSATITRVKPLLGEYKGKIYLIPRQSVAESIGPSD
jgi:hypothetical protein